MHLEIESRRSRRRSIGLAALLLTLFVGCSDDNSTTSAGTTGGSAGSGGASTGGNGGTAGAGAAGEGGTAGAGGTRDGAAGSAGSGQGGSAGQSPEGGSTDGGASSLTNFFVTSDTSKTGNLGGLAGADARCARLAAAAGLTRLIGWRAYLSTEAIDGGAGTNAHDRLLGAGQIVNSKGVTLAADIDALQALSGDAELFLDEHGQKIQGQWSGSPMPVEHDVLTGSTAEGKVLAGQTCRNWTSEDVADTAQVGHTDGLGPMMNPAPPYNSWNSSHANAGCNDTAPRGGAGRLYCFGIRFVD